MPSSPAKRIAVLKENIKRYNNKYTPPPGWPAGGLWYTPNITRVNQYRNWKRELKNLSARTIQKYHRAGVARRRAATAKTLNSVRTSNGRPLEPNAIRLIMSMLKSPSLQTSRRS